MNLLEHWYVSRFRPVAGGYLFEQWGCDVHFSEAEVTELRAEWRRIWLSPWLWGGWLALGVAVPALLYARGAVAGAIALAGVLALMLVVTLAHTHFRVNDRAQQRVSIAEVRTQRRRVPRALESVPFLALAGVMSLEAEGWWAVGWLLVAILHAAIILVSLWRWWRARSVAA
ncbi:hypothetical protein [Sphingomonas sp.]